MNLLMVLQKAVLIATNIYWSTIYVAQKLYVNLPNPSIFTFLILIIGSDQGSQRMNEDGYELRIISEMKRCNFFGSLKEGRDFLDYKSR